MTEQTPPARHPLWARILAGLILVLSLIYIGNPTGGVVELLLYALSPIDLIPGFIPVLGYLDGLLLALLGITMALKMIPPAILDECRERAQETLGQF